jgi:hypothetical protein
MSDRGAFLATTVVSDPEPWECQLCGARSWQQDDLYYEWKPRVSAASPAADTEARGG